MQVSGAGTKSDKKTPENGLKHFKQAVKTLPQTFLKMLRANNFF